MTFIESFNKAQALADSKQNRENVIALIGKDKHGDECFLQWIVASDYIADLAITSNIKSVRALAGTIG